MESSRDNSRKDRKKYFGKSNMVEEFLLLQIQRVQVELLNLQTHVNSGYIACIFINLMCRNREIYECTRFLRLWNTVTELEIGGRLLKYKLCY